MNRPDPRAIRTALAVAAVAFALAACSGGGGGSGGGSDAGGGSPPPAAPAGTTTRTLGWESATGPVAGYRVWVQRNGGSFGAEADVTESSVTLEGEPGEVARIMVAAFDAQGNVGPLSAPSSTFTFPQSEARAAGAAPATATTAGATTTRSFAAAPAAGGSEPSGADAGAPAPLVAPDQKTAWDASGDGAADLLWESGGALRITTALVETELIFSRPASDAAVAALADFDGDGTADPLWVGARGDVGYTPMAALLDDPARTPVVALGAIAVGERVVAAADFDGDGLADVLVRDEAGFTSLWLSNRDAPPDEAGLGEIADAVAGVADYDGDGAADILWRTASGSLVVWPMAGALALGAVEVSLPAAAEILASGDFDGDGAADVAWRDPATGAVSIVRPVVGAVEGWSPPLGDTRGWAARGAADFDGDGSADLLFERGDDLRIAYLPGDEVTALDPVSPWSLVVLPR